MVGKKEMQWELAKIRELFIQRMTVDSDHHDRRRKDYNQALFHYYSDDDVEWWNENCAEDYGLPKRKRGDTYQVWDRISVDMVLRCWDNAVRDYLTGRAPCAKVDAPMREGDSDA